MRNLFEREAVQEVMTRIEQLKPTSPRQWGKMDVAQMLAHCSAALEMASGKLVAKRTLLGRIVGPRVRHVLTDDSPFPRNSPTAKELKVGNCDFTQEHQRLKQCVRQFHEGGESRCTSHPHPFFGKITPLEWSTGMYKHLDHHLKQFGVWLLKSLQRQIDLPVHSFQSESMLPYLSSGRGKMRERALKVVMVLVGLLFVAGCIPLLIACVM